MHALAQALTLCHEDIRRWFLYHQECLLLRQDVYSAQCFQAFSLYLTEHMQYEDTVLFPAFLRAEHSLQWAINVYQKEHDKLRKMLHENQIMLDEYLAMQGRVKRLALLELLNKQRTFAHVMEHHEQREEQDLFLKLDEVTLDDALRQWHQLEQKLKMQTQTLAKEVDAYLWEKS